MTALPPIKTAEQIAEEWRAELNCELTAIEGNLAVVRQHVDAMSARAQRLREMLMILDAVQGDVGAPKADGRDPFDVRVERGARRGRGNKLGVPRASDDGAGDDGGGA